MLANISMIYKFPYKNALHMLYIFLNCLLVKNFSDSMDTPKIETNNYLRIHTCGGRITAPHQRLLHLNP